MEGWSDYAGAIVGFDADGGNAKVLVTPEDIVREGLDFSGLHRTR